MAHNVKYNKILDALQELLEEKNMQTISVSDIAQAAGVGKGSIYYYFPSKKAIWEALVERSYEKPLETAQNLASQTDVSPFTRMAMIFQACKTASAEFLVSNTDSPPARASEEAFIHQKFLNHLITEMKPALTEIIRQGITTGCIHFGYPEALAEIVLIVLSIKLDNTLIPSEPEEIENTLLGLISLLEKGTENPAGSLNFLAAL